VNGSRRLSLTHSHLFTSVIISLMGGAFLDAIASVRRGSNPQRGDTMSAASRRYFWMVADLIDLQWRVWPDARWSARRANWV
jgi:hypothetical protein